MGTLIWILSLVLRNASIVDQCWGLFYVLIGGFYFFRVSQEGLGIPNRGWLLFTLVTIWGLRLTVYLLWRNWGEPEDYRYQNFRQRFGADRYWWVSLFQVFWLQGTLAWLISSTLLGGYLGTVPLNWLDRVGVLVWLIGFIFEAGGDWQLARFKSNPENKGKLLTTGFWRYTRHPNYFGDAACWWGYACIALAAGNYVAPIGALIMTFLLVRVSGVAMLERRMVKVKPGYVDYVNQTSPFLPLPPRGKKRS